MGTTSQAYKKQVLDAYREAFMRVHGTEPSIMEYRGGWFSVQGEMDKCRLSKLEKMTRELQQAANTERP